jgi:hypothetical protein
MCAGCRLVGARARQRVARPPGQAVPALPWSPRRVCRCQARSRPTQGAIGRVYLQCRATPAQITRDRSTCSPHVLCITYRTITNATLKGRAVSTIYGLAAVRHLLRAPESAAARQQRLATVATAYVTME